MKKFTVVTSIFFVLLFCGMITFVALSKDFTPPDTEKKTIQEDDMDAPVWNQSIEDLVSYLSEKGLIDTGTKVTLSNEGLCTISLRYNGAEIYWWDLENLDKKSEEYNAFDSLRKKGEIDLYGSGNIIMPVRNGPFALLTTFYEGDVKALEKAFREFGQEE